LLMLMSRSRRNLVASSFGICECFRLILEIEMGLQMVLRQHAGLLNITAFHQLPSASSIAHSGVPNPNPII
jgi:hypothetical protein